MEKILEGKELYKTFTSSGQTTEALVNVSFFLEKGEVLGIVGESGSGKSTLLKVISGLVMPDKGELLHEGTSYKGKGPRHTGKFLQVIVQDAKSSFDPRMSVGKSIIESSRDGKNLEKVYELMEMVGLDKDLLSRKPSNLSGGQCQRMSIVRAYSSGASILLCDEMTSALDVTSQAQVIKIMQSLKKDGKLSAVFVSHDIALVSMLCDRIMVMKDGRCVEEGDTLDVIRSPKDEYTRQLIESAKRQSLDYANINYETKAVVNE